MTPQKKETPILITSVTITFDNPIRLTGLKQRDKLEKRIRAYLKENGLPGKVRVNFSHYPEI